MMVWGQPAVLISFSESESLSSSRLVSVYSSFARFGSESAADSSYCALINNRYKNTGVRKPTPLRLAFSSFLSLFSVLTGQCPFP